MASTYLDDFVLNFDLNHLAAQDNNQISSQKYEKLRKSTSWLKSKIISTDFAIQKYQAKKDDYEQSVKALSLTREELKQVCINYKDASDKCTTLENENKLLLANQEVLKERMTDIETKYDALVSHTNQLQMLVKQLENEKDALTVEKELSKCNNKDNSQEIIALQKEKDAMLNDLLALKDIVLGKKKPCTKHIKVLKKYIKDIKWKGQNILRSPEESDDEANEYPSLHRQRNMKEDSFGVGNELTSTEQNFIDNYSDGEVSVDTGRGSSRANSHDKYLNSPEHVVAEPPQKVSSEYVLRQSDAANSPITVFSSRSVGTSPIMYDQPVALFEDQYNVYTDCFDGPDYITDEMPLSEEINILVEKEKMAGCPSPVSDLDKCIDTEKGPVDNCEYFLKKSKTRSLQKSLFSDSDESNEFDEDSIIAKQISKCLCEKSNTLAVNEKKKEKFVGACICPVSILPSFPKFVDNKTGIAEHHKCVNIDKNSEFGNQKSRSCEKSTCTDTVMSSDRKEYVNVCTSPIAVLNYCCKCVSQDMDSFSPLKCENQVLSNCEKSPNRNTSAKKKLIDVSTNTAIIPPPRKLVDIGTDALFQDPIESSEKSQFVDKELPLTVKQIPKSFNNKILKTKEDTPCPREQLRAQEKVCLESNSSKNLHFESTNDVEVQNILNVMKLHHDLISPISKTPFDSSQYLKLIPEMNSTLNKIWTTLANAYKMPKQLTNRDSDILHATEPIEVDHMSEVETINRERLCNEQPISLVSLLNRNAENDIADPTHETDLEINSVTGETDRNGFSDWANMPITERSNDTEPKRTSDIFANKPSPDVTKQKKIITAQEKISPEQEIEMPSILHEKFEDINYTKKNDEINLTVDDDSNTDESDSQQQCTENYSELNDNSNGNFSNYTNQTDTCNNSEVPVTRTIINGTKTKKKSKLEKFRNKLLPTCKIKKMTPPIIKRSLKSYNIKPKETLSSLNQKSAYENAVKVMAELRSNQIVQDTTKQFKSVTRHPSPENKSNKIELLFNEGVDLKVLSTRSRTRKLSKKDENSTVNTSCEQNVKDKEKSSLNRKVRKRPADTEIDSLQRNCKRMLRSSKVPQITNENSLPVVRNDNALENKRKDNVICSDDSLSECNEAMNDVETNNLNSVNHNYSLPNTDAVSVKSDVTLEKDVIRKAKPVIELSKCLADNANVVSIAPGNVGYLDVNKNINTRIQLDQNELSKVNTLNLENADSVAVTMNHCIRDDDKVTNTIKDTANNDLIESNNSEFTNTKEYSVEDLKGNASEVKTGENNHRINGKESFHIIDTKQDDTHSLELKLREKNDTALNDTVAQLMPVKNDVTVSEKNVISYSDLDLYTTENNIENVTNVPLNNIQHRKENILCTALDRYGVISVKYAAKKVPDTITLKICNKIEESIEKIVASSKAEQKSKMDELVSSIQSYKRKHILAGLMKYLRDPTRKNELFNKIVNGPAPPMTKSEVILLYVIESLNCSLPPGFINRLWNNIEHALFQLNHAPEFDVIESMSHFYAVLCRYFRNKSRLRCFMLDAMYCLQFKAVPLIRQCLDVCPGVLPNAHERMAKTSLVTCLVYLLHFYKCQDKFNRAQDIRNILYRRYQYRFSEWNETMILEIFRKAIMDLRGTHNDKKMLRVALIILCKRHGAKWCQLNIIQNILLPIIEKRDVPDRIKQFCVLMLGPLLKPFPADRKAQCEIVINQLLQMLKQNNSQEMKEAIYSSLIFMNKHDQDRVVQALLSWNPESVSSDFEEILNDYVMERPLAMWKKLVTKKPSHCT